LFSAPAFHAAWPIVGVLAWQSLFYGFYLVASAGIWKAERTTLSMFIMLGAALLNLGLNALLVPSLGGLGAAVATALSFLAWIIAALAISERLWPVGFPLPVLAGQIALGVVTTAWLLAFGSDSWVGAIGAHAAVVLLLVSAIDRRGAGSRVAKGGAGA
jgi:O-antigen/teichoic acid export membrane protein